MLNVIKSMALDPDNDSACRYLVIDALNVPKVIEFYKKNGFEFIFKSEEQEFQYLHSRDIKWFSKLKAFFCLNGYNQKGRCKTRLMVFDLIILKTEL